jgi:hypothetical protein
MLLVAACVRIRLWPLIHHHLVGGVRVHGAVALLVAHRIQSRVEVLMLLSEGRLLHEVAGVVVHLGHGLEIAASVGRSVLLLRAGVMII